jgi:hypothetical protein
VIATGRLLVRWVIWSMGDDLLVAHIDLGGVAVEEDHEAHEDEIQKFRKILASMRQR